MKFTRDGKYVKEWGTKGSGAGQISEPHAIAMDSRGRLFVGSRSCNCVQIFDQSGKFIDQWAQFSRPSGVFIDKDDNLYVADSESGPSNNTTHPGGWQRGIRIGSARDGKVTAFIPEPSVEAGAPEGVGVDDAGNVYAGWTAKMAVRR